MVTISHGLPVSQSCVKWGSLPFTSSSSVWCFCLASITAFKSFPKSAEDAIVSFSFTQASSSSICSMNSHKLWDSFSFSSRLTANCCSSSLAVFSWVCRLIIVAPSGCSSSMNFCAWPLRDLACSESTFISLSVSVCFSSRSWTLSKCLP